MYVNVDERLSNITLRYQLKWTALLLPFCISRIDHSYRCKAQSVDKQSKAQSVDKQSKAQSVDKQSVDKQSVDKQKTQSRKQKQKRHTKNWTDEKFGPHRNIACESRFLWSLSSSFPFLIRHPCCSYSQTFAISSLTFLIKQRT